jgi:sulfite reductase beta subunit-like hemoprotein
VKILSAALAESGLILDPEDPRRRVAACVGAPACLNATTDVRGDAARLAALVDVGTLLHVSGCAKGCAHPRAATVTLTGRNGSYDLVHNGSPSDSPSLTGLTLDEAAAHLRQITADKTQGGTA